MKRFWAAAMSMMLVMTSPGFKVQAEESTEPEYTSVSFADEGMPDDERILGYIDREVTGQIPEYGRFRASMGKISGNLLSGPESKLYDFLKPKIEAVAAGKLTSTVFDITPGDIGIKTEYTADELGLPDLSNFAKAFFAVNEKSALDIYSVVKALLADCPYDLYWFDKTSGYTNNGFSAFPRQRDGQEFMELSGNMKIRMYVSEDYASGDFTTDPAKISAVNTAVKNISNVISKHAKEPDYQKLDSYRKDICSYVSYNRDVQAGNTPYGNPWQLIWVFDGDPSTTVVCEGYSKAFKYLTDLSTFNSPKVSCILTDGLMSTGNGYGSHMWNIVTMDDGKNYLADITNCDEGMIGEEDSLFLCGAKTKDNRNFSVDIPERVVGNMTYPAGTIKYTYDIDVYEYYAGTGRMKLSETKYTKVSVNAVGLNKNSLTLLTGKSEKLTATVFPSNASDKSVTWSTDNAGVATVSDGTVKGVAAGTARITVKTNDGGYTATAVVTVKDPTFGEWEIIREPTCEESGIKRRICIEDPSIYEAEGIPALGHDYVLGGWNWSQDHTSAWVDVVCTRDSSHARTVDAFVREEITEGGCDTGGVRIVKAAAGIGDKVFEDQYQESFEAEGHAYGLPEYSWAEDRSSVTAEMYCRKCGDVIKETAAASYEVVKEPTCSEAGEGRYTAVFENPAFMSQVRTVYIDPTGHDFGEWRVMQGADCRHEGVETRVCSHSIDHEETRVIPRQKHTYGEWYVEQEAGADTDGLMKRRCEFCSKEETKVIPALNHVHELVKAEAAEPYCDEEGNIEYWVCEHDGMKFADAEGTIQLQDEEVIVEPIGHSYEFSEMIWSDDHTSAMAAFICDRNLAHKMNLPADVEIRASVKPECETEGVLECHASVVYEGQKYEETIEIPVNKRGHTYGEPVIIREPSCQEKGAEARICAHDSSHMQISELPRAHQWGEWKVSGDKEIRTCTVCGAEDTRGIAPEGHKHNLVKVEEKDASCEEDGNISYMLCEEDGMKFSSKGVQLSDMDVVIPATGHSWMYPSWEWNNAHNVYAVFTCTHDRNHVKKIRADVHVIQNDDGSRQYTAQVTGEDGKVYADTMNISSREGFERIFGKLRYDTSRAIADKLKEQFGVEQFDAVIVANGRNFADALGGCYLSYVKQAPILIISDKNENTQEDMKKYILSNLKADGMIYILGGTAAVPSNMESGLDGYQIRRLAGADRYQTNLAVLEEAGVGDEDILISTGNGYADSLSASSAKRPVMLVSSKNGLNIDQKAYLSLYKGNRFYVLGGETVVKPEVEEALKTYGETKRLGGANRFETSVMIAEEFSSNADEAVFAYSGGFPDGLCGGLLAASNDAPLILTRYERTEQAEAFCSGRNIHYGIVLGGPGTDEKPMITDQDAKGILD